MGKAECCGFGVYCLKQKCKIGTRAKREYRRLGLKVCKV